MNKIKIEHYKKQYGGLLAFLVIELLIFTSLNLANYGILFRYLSIILVAALIPITMLKYRQEDWLNVALAFVLPLAAYGAFMAFSPLYLVLQTVVDDIVMLLSLVAFLLIGVSMAQNEEFKIEKGLAAIVGGLAVLLAIGLVYTIWRYTFFYVLRFDGMNLYYDGEAYLISNEAKWLFGFEFHEVKLAFFANYGIFLSPLLLGLLFVDFKHLKKLDFVWIAAGALGVLSLLLLPDFGAFKFVIPAVIIAAAVRFLPNNPLTKKVIFYGSVVAGVLFSLAALFLLLYAFEVPFAANLVTNNAIFNRVFGNSIVQGYAEVIQASIQHPFGGLHSVIVNANFIESTRSSFFDTLYQGGIVATLGYLAFMVCAGIYLVRYYRQSQDPRHIKIILILFVATHVFTSLFRYEYAPFVRENQRIYKIPFFSDLLTLLDVFLVGYAYHQGQPSKQNKSEAVLASPAI
ncbi:MAG: hypothetical protein WC399_00550 [Bacilli bacterium]|jgi:hypothetical protein